MVKADDDDWDPDPDLQALMGSPGGGGGADEISGLLLELICACTKLQWLLSEADEAEFKVVVSRLAAFKRAANDLPSVAPMRRRVGFKVTPRKKRTKK